MSLNIFINQIWSGIGSSQMLVMLFLHRVFCLIMKTQLQQEKPVAWILKLVETCELSIRDDNCTHSRETRKSIVFSNGNDVALRVYIYIYVHFIILVRLRQRERDIRHRISVTFDNSRGISLNTIQRPTCGIITSLNKATRLKGNPISSPLRVLR